MRFRAKQLDIGCITRFSKVVATLTKSVKVCVLRLTPDKLYFVVVERGTVGGINVWCELSQENFFDDYKIEGKDENNEIYLEVALDQLSRTLKTAHNAQVVKIKLVKKQGAFLMVEVIQPSLVGAQRTVVHDIPVMVVPQRLWADYQEPAMPDIDVSIYLPPLRLLKSVVDRMKNLSCYLMFSANMNGELTLKVETDTVSVATYFKELENHQFDDGIASSSSSTAIRSREQFSQVTVDIKRFGHLMQGQFAPMKAICNVVNGRALQVFLLHEDVSLQYFIPAMMK
ncbi:checkpoint protein HUS1-like isoform X2 [Dysidea avara]|uniref:checkpoint protein HUS1-like isoform X2 n=1 Tax=Dysidea avara TaxID=196820 RepID=UPI00331AC344